MTQALLPTPELVKDIRTTILELAGGEEDREAALEKVRTSLRRKNLYQMLTHREPSASPERLCLSGVRLILEGFRLWDRLGERYDEGMVRLVHDRKGSSPVKIIREWRAAVGMHISFVEHNAALGTETVAGRLGMDLASYKKLTGGGEVPRADYVAATEKALAAFADYAAAESSPLRRKLYGLVPDVTPGGKRLLAARAVLAAA